MKNSFILYVENREQVELLSTEQRADLLMALFDYAEKGETEELDPLTAMAFTIFRAKIDRDAAKYEEICEKRRIAASAGGKASASKSKQMEANATKCDQVQHDTVPDPEPDTPKSESNRRKRFVPPTEDEVSVYVSEKGYNVDPEQFIAYYSSQGWKKNNGLPVTDWKAAVRTWVRRNKPQAPPGNRFQNFTQRPNNYDDLQRQLVAAQRGAHG